MDTYIYIPVHFLVLEGEDGGSVLCILQIEEECREILKVMEFIQPLPQQMYEEWECKMKKTATVLGFMEIDIPQVVVGG